MTPREREIRLRLRDSFEYYAPRCLKIRTKSGAIKPLRLNAAQRFLHARLEEQRKTTERVRALILKGRQQGACYSPDMRLLTNDYRWIRIGDVEVRQEIVCVDENLGQLNRAGRRQERRIRKGVVEAVRRFMQPVFEVEFHTGVKLVVTGEHRHLRQRRGAVDAIWRQVGDMKIGDSVRVMCGAPTRGPPTSEDGWFGGLLDGEGSFGASPAIRIAVSQVDGQVLQRAKRYLRDRGIDFYELIDRRTSGVKSKLGDKPVHCLRVDRFADVISILSRTRPSRFVERFLTEGKKLPTSSEGFDAWARVVSIKELGVQEVVDIQASQKTYICEGLVSHNSTYTEARFFHQVTHRRGTRAFILTHMMKRRPTCSGWPSVFTTLPGGCAARAGRFECQGTGF
jgi:hypothetical protein